MLAHGRGVLAQGGGLVAQPHARQLENEWRGYVFHPPPGELAAANSAFAREEANLPCGQLGENGEGGQRPWMAKRR